MLFLSLHDIWIKLISMLLHIFNLNSSETNWFHSGIELINLFQLLNFLLSHFGEVSHESFDSCIDLGKDFGLRLLVHLNLSQDLSSHLFILGNQELFGFLIVIQNRLRFHGFLVLRKSVPFQGRVVSCLHIVGSVDGSLSCWTNHDCWSHWRWTLTSCWWSSSLWAASMGKSSVEALLGSAASCWRIWALWYSLHNFSRFCTLIWSSVIDLNSLIVIAHIIWLNNGWDLFVIHDCFTAPFQRLLWLHHVLEHRHLTVSLVVVNPIFESMVASTDSKGQIALFQLNTDSHQTKQVKVVFNVDKWNRDSNFLNFSLDCFLNFSVLSLLLCGKDDWWMVK